MSIKNHIYPKIAVCLVCILILSPIFLVIISSFLSADDLLLLYGKSNRYTIRFTDIMHFKFTAGNFLSLLSEQHHFIQALINSTIICLTIVTGNTCLSICTAYVFSKINFKGRDTFYYILILIMLMPVLVKLVPNFIILRKFGLTDRLTSVIIPGIFNPFGIFILRQYFNYVPDEYIHSARLDGATYGSSLFHVAAPLSKSGIIAVLIFNIIDSWGMIEQPLVFLNDEAKYPLSLFLFSIGESRIGAGFAASVLFMVPVLAVFFLGKSHMLKGMYISGLR